MSIYDCIGHRLFSRTEMGNGEVEAGGTKPLRLGSAVRNPALYEGADDLREEMTLLALVELGMAASAHSGLSSQSSMNSVRSIRPSSRNARSSWFWRR